MGMESTLDELSNEQYCYLTTTGRVTGRAREIEIWFGLIGKTLYMLSGGRDRSNWVRNLKRQPEVTVRIGGITFHAKARIIDEDAEEDSVARKLLLEKYQPTHDDDLSEWSKTALPVALDVEE